MNKEYFENHQEEFEQQQQAAQEVEEVLARMDSSFEDYENNAYDADMITPAAEPTEEQTRAYGDMILRELEACASAFTSEQKGKLLAISEEVEENSTPKERLYAEAETLRENIMLLQNFLKKRDDKGTLISQSMGLTNAQLFLMHRQVELEKELYDVLASRISIFDVRVVDAENNIVEVAK